MQNDKDYQEYLEYLQYMESMEEPGAAPSPQYQAPIGPGVGAVQSMPDALERAKTIVGLGDKQALWPEGSNPEKYPVKGTPPMVAPAAGMAQAAGKIGSTMASQGPMPMVGFSTRAADLANKNFATRIASNAGSSGLEALMKGHPEDALDQAETSAGVSTALEALGGLGKLLAKPIRAVGRGLTRVTKDQAKNYADNFKVGDELFEMEKNSPDELAERALRESRDALRNLQQNSTDPAVAELNERITGKTFRVRPDQFKGTAAGNEVDRAWQAQGKELDVPVFERHPVQATPVKAGIEYGKPSVQKLPANPSRPGFDPYAELPTTEVSTVKNTISKAGEPETLESLLLPRGAQKVSAPVPDELSLTGPQLMRAKRASGEAMAANQAKNPQGYRAGDDAEAAAMIKMRKAMRSVDPKAADLDRVVEKDLRLSREVRNMGNPARIYSSNETLGSVPIRQVQQHLDEKTGSNFMTLAKALEGSRAVHHPGSGVFDDNVTRPLGRSLLRNSKRASEISSTHKAPLWQAIADLLNQHSKE